MQTSEEKASVIFLIRKEIRILWQNIEVQFVSYAAEKVKNFS
jgi:hypothetical protein